MIYYGFLAVLVATALAGPPQLNNDKSTETEDRPVPMSDICFFLFPTFACTMKCDKLKQEAYCDQQQKCLCRAEQQSSEQRTLEQDEDQEHQHHETQQDGSAQTPAPSTSNLPEHTVEATITAKPSEEPPMKCFLGFRPLVCERRCVQRGLQAHCEARTDGEFCVCVARNDDQPQHLNTNTALIRLPSAEEAPLMCFLGRKPLTCVLKCQQRDQESYCDERNLCVCGSQRHHEDKLVISSIDGQDESNTMCSFGTPKIPCYKKCMAEGGQPTCDQMQSCVCQNQDEIMSISISGSVSEEIDEEPDVDDENDNSPTIVMYFMKLTKLFGDENKTENTPESSSGPQDPREIYYMQKEGWSYQHLLTVLVLGMLCFFILLELLSCYRRKKNRSKVDNIFQTMSTPNKS